MNFGCRGILLQTMVLSEIKNDTSRNFGCSVSMPFPCIVCYCDVLLEIQCDAGGNFGFRVFMPVPTYLLCCS